MGLADSTIKTYCSILSQFFEHTKKTTNFTEQEINDYLDYLMIVRNYSGRSRNLVMKVIRFYCRELKIYKLLLVKRQIKQILKNIENLKDNNLFGIEIEKEPKQFADFMIKGGLNQNPILRHFMIKNL